MHLKSVESFESEKQAMRASFEGAEKLREEMAMKYVQIQDQLTLKDQECSQYR